MGATSALTRIILAVCGIGLILCLAYGSMDTKIQPDGDWDAWAIWNLHARVLSRAPSLWRVRLPAMTYSHPDYPLLQPLVIARLWAFAGKELPSAPVLVSFVFGFAPLMVVSSSLAVMKTWLHGAVAFVFLAGCNSLVHLGISEYADSAVSLFIVSTFVLLTASELYNQERLLVLAGLSAGFAAWAKNEGGLFIAALGLVGLLLMGKPENRARIKVRTACFAAGVFLPILCLFVFRRLVPAQSDVIGWFVEWNRWPVDFTRKRIWLILKSYGNQIWKLEPWPVPPLLWLAIFFDSTGATESSPHRRSAYRGLAVLGTMLLAYIFVYATSAQDLTWYLSTSLQRLVLQIWPALVFLVFMMTRAPIPVPGEPDGRSDTFFNR